MENEKSFLSFIDKAPLGYQSLDFDGNFIEVNNQWLDTLGYSRKEVIGKWFGDFLTLVCREGFRQRFPIFKAKGKIHSEFEMVHKTGKILLIAFDGKIAHDLNGNFLQTHCILQDITERRLTEEALKESENKYRDLVENSPDSIVIYVDGIIVFANKESLNLMGAAKKEEIVGKSVFQFVHPDYRELVIERMTKMVSKGAVLPLAEEKFVRIDGTEVTVEIKAVLVTHENKRAVQLIIRDITDRKQAEDKLFKSEEKYDALYESVQDVFFKTDLAGILLDLSPSVIYFSDFNREELIGTPVSDIYYDQDERIELLNAITKNGEIRDYELKIKAKNNEIRYGSINARLISDLQGNPSYIYGSIRDITDRKQAEQALNDSRQQFIDILDLQPDATFVIDNEKKVIVWNKAIEEMTGTLKQDIIGKGDHAYAIPFYGKKQNLFLDLIDNNKKLEAQYSNVQRKGHTLQAEVFAPALFNGKGAYIAVLGAPLFNSMGKRIGSIESIRDITDRVATDNALLESEKLYHTLFEQSSDAIFLVDIASGNYLDANRAAEILTGRSLNELKKMKTSEITPKEAIKRIRMLMDKKDPLEIGEIEYVRSDGTIRIALLNTVSLNNGQVFGIAHDVTESKQAEEVLKNSLALTDATIESIHNGILVVSDHRKVIKSNEKFTELWRIPDNILESGDDKTLLDYVTTQLTDPSEFIAKISELYGKPESESIDLIQLKDGRIFERISKPFCLDGKPSGRVWSFLDITDRKQAEEEILIAKKHAEESDRLKTAFLANISHEIRTPLNSILGFSEMLKEPTLNSEEQQEYTSIIEKSGYRMLNIIDEIISFSKIESGEINTYFSEININEQIESIYSHFKSEIGKDCNRIQFKHSMPEKETTIVSDKDKINTILTSLIRNAIKFTDRGYIEFGFEKRDKYLEFFVKDSGVGIPAAQKELVFERFRQGSESLTRNYEGIGLGLSIAKAFVKILGGKIWIESEEGIGSIFKFTIPLVSVPSLVTPIEP